MITQKLQPQLNLILHQTMPAIETAWMAGYEAAQADLAESENYYDSGSQEADVWSEGWWSGFYGEKPIYTKDGHLSTIHSDSPLAANDCARRNPHHFSIAKIVHWPKSKRAQHIIEAVAVAGAVAIYAMAVGE